MANEEGEREREIRMSTGIRGVKGEEKWKRNGEREGKGLEREKEKDWIENGRRRKRR